MPHRAGGRIKLLAVNTIKRATQAPDVPTVAEVTGIKDFDYPPVIGILAPAKTPQAVVERLNAETQKALALPAVRTRLEELGAAFDYAALVQAVKDGARLRLRPKVMTVATIVASLMPIMWSHRQGSEVMQPLATPVIGGMISSLIHILIVTPVIFLWLREREQRRSLSRKTM